MPDPLFTHTDSRHCELRITPDHAVIHASVIDSDGVFEAVHVPRDKAAELARAVLVAAGDTEGTDESALVSDARHERDAARAEASELRRALRSALSSPDEGGVHTTLSHMRKLAGLDEPSAPCPVCGLAPADQELGPDDKCRHAPATRLGKPTDPEVERLRAKLAQVQQERDAARTHVAAYEQAASERPASRFYIDPYENEY